MTDQPRTLGDSAVAEPQGNGQTDGPTMHLRIDDRNMSTHYVNAFRSNSTAEEVVLDIGFNVIERHPQPNADDENARNGQVRLNIDNRVVMNYATAKRLALTLGQIVRRYEDRFGEIQLGRENAPADGAAEPGDQ